MTQWLFPLRPGGLDYFLIISCGTNQINLIHHLSLSSFFCNSRVLSLSSPRFHPHPQLLFFLVLFCSAILLEIYPTNPLPHRCSFCTILRLNNNTLPHLIHRPSILPSVYMRTCYAKVVRRGGLHPCFVTLALLLFIYFNLYQSP